MHLVPSCDEVRSFLDKLLKESNFPLIRDTNYGAGARSVYDCVPSGIDEVPVNAIIMNRRK